MSTINFKNPEQCRICHDEDFADNEIFARVHNTHDFHDACIRAYASKYGSKSYECPAGCGTRLTEANVTFWRRNVHGTYERVNADPLIDNSEDRFNAKFLKLSLISLAIYLPLCLIKHFWIDGRSWH